MELSDNACNQYHKMLWPDGKYLAFTMSYDDGVEQDVRLIELMNQYGIKGTFNLNSGLMGKREILTFYKNAAHNMLPQDQICEVYREYEVACHGHMHVPLPTLSSVERIRELLLCREKLECLTGQPIVGYAYAVGPYDSHCEQYLRMCGLAYARTTKSTGTFDVPQNFYYWHPTCHHQDPQLFQLAEGFLKEPDIPFLRKKLFYVWGHSYEFDPEQNWDCVESLFKIIGGRDDVWYATNRDVVFYARAFQQLIFSVDGRQIVNPNSINIWIEVDHAPVCIAAGTHITLKT